MDTLRTLLSARFALWGLALLLALFGAGNLFVALFVPARYEVTYQLNITLSHCAGEQCAISAMLEVANSGSEPQQEVVVTLAGWPGNVAGRAHTINLDASLPRSGDPEVIQEQAAEGYRLRLLQLAPGALTQVYFSALVPREALRSAMDAELAIQGRGRMVEADPRGLAFGRWFTALDAAAPSLS